MKTKALWGVRCAAILGLTVAAPVAAALYTPHDLGTLGASSGQSIAYDINGTGVVVGESQTNGGSSPLHATVWYNGKITDLGTLGGAVSVAYAVSNNGLIVGYSEIPNRDNQYHHAFLWNHGAMADLGTLGGITSVARGVNNAAQVVGESTYIGDSYDYHAFLWQNGSLTDLTPNAARASALDINGVGQIVGYASPQLNPGRIHAMLWQNGQATDLHGSLPLTVKTYAAAINEYGQIAGYVENGSLQQAVTWINGTLTYLPAWSGGGSTIAYDINNAGQIVGSATTAGGSPHAVLWQNGRIIDLGTLGGRSSRAQAINGVGQIAGWSAFLAGTTGPLHATLWTK